MGLFSNMFGSHSQRELKRLWPIANEVLALDDKFKAMTDDELKSMTPKLKAELGAGKTLDDILPEAFATVREAASRVLGMKHYPVQVLGGIVLHQGRIAEMKTGEGKTMVATLPAYLNALAGNGVHIVTVNSYLASRDSEWMGKVYRFLGLTVGLVVHGLDDSTKKAAYAADITYGTNNEFGFDYLRDNMALYRERMVQRGHSFAIVDEVDSILIDEARTPLIISGTGSKPTELYEAAERFVNTLKMQKLTDVNDKADLDKFAQMEYNEIEMGRFITREQHAALKDADYIVDEKNKNATLTPNGIKKAEAFFSVENLSAPENMELMHHINQAVRAHGIMRRDIDYVVKDGQIIIVDEFTGRLMYGRRYNQGLHQAIEAKEHVKVEKESKTLASITLQNYFRLYKKLSGMTGTALTEEEEFRQIYALDVIELPTNKPNIRVDLPDLVFKTESAKFDRAVSEIKEIHESGAPVLVGTISIEKSERLSQMLKRAGIKHQVLNAKHHEKEAQIIAQAGALGTVTIATNMAGRGTDIVLGGNPEYLARAQLLKEGVDEAVINEAVGFADTDDSEILAARQKYRELYDKFKAETEENAKKVKDAGGLHIIGTERHESRRIDNQLRGRAARQGDPGSTRFLLSLEDDLMRLFGGERVQGMMNALRVDDDMPIENKMLTRTIERAQERVEGMNFQRRKTVLEYDDIMNQQREIVYSQRLKVLDGDDLEPVLHKMISEIADSFVERYLNSNIPDDWNTEGLREELSGLIPLDDDFESEKLLKLEADDIKELIVSKINSLLEAKRAELGPVMDEAQRVVMLRSVDRRWMDHIDDMDELRRGIGLMAYGQRDPLVEYKFQSYDIFEQMSENIKLDTIRGILSLKLRKGEDEPKREAVAKVTSQSHGADAPAARGTKAKAAGGSGTVRVTKVGRNDPCPCGSGLKYKKCCGKDE